VAAPAPAPALPRPDLGSLLQEDGLVADRGTAFRKLFARWQLDSPADDLRPCNAAARAGFECVDARGTWLVIRRLDLPVVMKLSPPDGRRRYAGVTALDGERARLEFGERSIRVPISEIESRWDGAFVFAWKVPPIVTRVLNPGMRGKDVEWLSRQLDELDGQP